MIRQYGRHVWLTILMAALPQACLAQAEASVETRPVQLETITILGTRIAKDPDQVSRSIDVIEQDQIAHEQSSTLGEIVDVLPNVNIMGGPRPAAQQIRIRGLTGQHILLVIDGIRQDFDVGHMGTGFIAPGLIESVQVQRGPAAVFWGGGAIGGVVSVNTKEAADLLAEGQDIGARLHAGYQSVSEGWATRGAVYGHLGNHVDALVQIGHSDHENLELGDGSTLPHSAYQRTSLLMKSTVHMTPGNSLQFSHRRMRMEGISPGAPAGTGSSLEKREITVGASRVEWRFLPIETKLIDLTVGLSHIRTEVDEKELGAHQHDNTLISGLGLDLTNTSRFDLSTAGRHVLTYGFDVNRKSIEATRNGHPRQTTPNGTRLLAGVFVQDEIRWNEAWTTTFGLRYDRYHSESESGVAPDKDDGELSLQAGVMWQPVDWLQLYASYAQAYRAPSIGEMYISGSHFYGTFKPNPNLKPETAANKEVGVRTEWQGLFTSGDQLQFELTVFRNDIENYIQSYSSGTFPNLTITYKNVGEVRLEGFEAVASYSTDAWFVNVNYGQTRGYNETADHPLANIPADTWVVRAGITALPWDGRITWRMTHAEAQDRVAPDEPTTDSYTVYDLLTSWHPTPNLRLDAGITNLTDLAYRRHTALVQAPGRSFKLGLTLKF